MITIDKAREAIPAIHHDDLYILFISFMSLPRVFGAESSSNSGGVASDQVGLKNIYVVQEGLTTS